LSSTLPEPFEGAQEL